MIDQERASLGGDQKSGQDGERSQSDLTVGNKSAIFNNRVNLRPFEMNSNNVSANVSRKGSVILDQTPIQNNSFVNYSDKDDGQAASGGEGGGGGLSINVSREGSRNGSMK